MPNKKKRTFTKENSVKFKLKRGNSQAVNADGEKLPGENVLEPVDENYKAHASLLMSTISSLCDVEGSVGPKEEPNLEKILDQLEDSDSDIMSLQSGMNHLNMDCKEKRSNIVEEICSDGSDEFYVVESQFSDVSDDFFDDKEYTQSDTHQDCPENIKIFNARFEKVLEEYEEDQIGPLDDEEICGNLSTDCQRVQNLFQSDPEHEDKVTLEPCDATIKEKILSYAEESEDENIVEIVTIKPLEFDCESILSAYSNKYNHPAVIKEDKVKRMRIPKNPMKKGLTKSQLKSLDTENRSDDESEDNFSVSSKFNVRSKGETPEEKRERKNLFKEAKRESRMLKKENKLAFKIEKKIQAAQALNAQHTKGIKLL